MIPREGVESFTKPTNFIDDIPSRVIPREGVESISDAMSEAQSCGIVIPREGVESYPCQGEGLHV